MNKDVAFYKYLEADWRQEQIRQLQLAQLTCWKLHNSMTKLRKNLEIPRITDFDRWQKQLERMRENV
jgi:hypothetical protein